MACGICTGSQTGLLELIVASFVNEGGGDSYAALFAGNLQSLDHFTHPFLPFFQLYSIFF